MAQAPHFRRIGTLPAFSGCPLRFEGGHPTIVSLCPFILADESGTVQWPRPPTLFAAPPSRNLWDQTTRNDLEIDLLVLLYDVARHMRTYVDQMAREHGMPRAQWIIVARLEGQPDLSQNELAALAEVAPIPAARLVDRLEGLGLVKRHTDPEDRRVWRLRLTLAAVPVVRDAKQGASQTA